MAELARSPSVLTQSTFLVLYHSSCWSQLLKTCRKHQKNFIMKHDCFKNKIVVFFFIVKHFSSICRSDFKHVFSLKHGSFGTPLLYSVSHKLSSATIAYSAISLPAENFPYKSLRAGAIVNCPVCRKSSSSCYHDFFVMAETSKKKTLCCREVLDSE